MKALIDMFCKLAVCLLPVGKLYDRRLDCLHASNGLFMTSRVAHLLRATLGFRV
jgi:hypothetical protein